MPILTIQDEDKQYKTIEQRKENRGYRTQEDLKTSNLFNKEAPLETIIRYPRGMKWEVDYFLQLRDINDTVDFLDINISPQIQKYNRINKLILVLQSPITQGNIDEISGEAIVNAGFLPSPGDMFIATLTGGRECLFGINKVETRTYNIHKAYYINFQVYKFLDDKPEFYNNLVQKTMKEYVYDKDHLLDYSAPVILAQDYKIKLSLRDTLPEITDYYMDKMVNHEKRVIALPTNSSIYVDPYLNSFIFKVINHTEKEVFDKLQNIEISVSNDTPYTIWDVLIERNPRMIKRCRQDIGFKYHAYGLSQVMTKMMNYLGINFIATPGVTSDGTLTGTSTGASGSIGSHNYDTKFWGHYHPKTPDNRWYNHEEEQKHYDHTKVCRDNCPGHNGEDSSSCDCGCDDCDCNQDSNLKDLGLSPKPDGYVDPLDGKSRTYVLSADFYNENSDGYALIERLVMLYLTGHIIPADELQKLIDNYMYWSTMDQYYLLPILVLLIKEAMAHTFKSL